MTQSVLLLLLITILQSSHSLTRKKWQTADAPHLRNIDQKTHNRNRLNYDDYDRNLQYRSNLLKAKQMAAANYRRNKKYEQNSNEQYRSHLNQSYQAYVQSQCPTGCVCHTNNLIRCTFKFFTRVPEGLPIDVEQLNTRGKSF